MDRFSETFATSNSGDVKIRLPPQKAIVAVALFLMAVGAIALSRYGWKQSVLFLIGGALGIALYTSGFGFASAYRKLVAQRDVRGIYAQLLMLAVAVVLFAPVLASGAIGEQPVRGAIAPVGVAGAIGAFLFGIGMQLGGVCGCGTLYVIGGGGLSLLLTLLTFCIGAFAASLTRQIWNALPTTQPIVLGTAIGWTQAVVMQLLLLALLAGVLHWWSRSHQQSETTDPSTDQTRQAWVQDTWPLLAGAIALAVLDWFTLILSGQPWRITWGFALWAAQLATWLGWDPASSPFWNSGFAQTALRQGIFADVSSVMNIGIILGALLAAALAGRLVPIRQIRRPEATSKLLGGLIMGYGAFLAYGCNISAFLGGIASTSVHGWIWIVAALAGTLIGVRLRLWFRLD